MADTKGELKKLQQNGFVLIERVRLSPDETERIRQRINYAREQGVGGRFERRRQYVVRYPP